MIIWRHIRKTRPHQRTCWIQIVEGQDGIRLTTGTRIAETSSKGNQEKWRENDRWYKLDFFGYEELAETVI